MVKSFRNIILNEFPELLNAKVVLAISGGLDSVVLAHLLQQAGIDLSLAHCNFQLRGEDSDQDQYFVEELAEDQELPIYTIRFETAEYSKRTRKSIQVSARELRYAWFDELKLEYGFDYLVTAHHLDDSLETFMINLSRGTGIKGLLGIPAKQAWIRRPLLQFTRDEIKQLAEENQITWREDASNADDKYLRNAIRLHVIPALKGLNPKLMSNFRNSLGFLKQTDQLADSFGEEEELRIRSPYKNLAGVYQYPINLISESEHRDALLYSFFYPKGFHNLKDLNNLLNAHSGKFLENDRYRLLKNREELLLEDKARKLELNNSEILENAELDSGSYQIEVPKDLLKNKFEVRPWKNGDYFYPKGISGKKKLSEYFRDEKLSIIEKERVKLLVYDSDIVWIIGYRKDKRFLAEQNEKTKTLTIRLS